MLQNMTQLETGSHNAYQSLRPPALVWSPPQAPERIPSMQSPTADELLASVFGLSPEHAQQIADHVDVCKGLLAAGTDMDTVQQHLKDQGVPIITSILITRHLGDQLSTLRAAREIVECSPARTPSTTLSQPSTPHHPR